MRLAIHHIERRAAAVGPALQHDPVLAHVIAARQIGQGGFGVERAHGHFIDGLALGLVVRIASIAVRAVARTETVDVQGKVAAAGPVFSPHLVPLRKRAGIAGRRDVVARAADA